MTYYQIALYFRSKITSYLLQFYPKLRHSCIILWQIIDFYFWIRLMNLISSKTAALTTHKLSKTKYGFFLHFLNWYNILTEILLVLTDCVYTGFGVQWKAQTVCKRWRTFSRQLRYLYVYVCVCVDSCIYMFLCYMDNIIFFCDMLWCVWNGWLEQG